MCRVFDEIWVAGEAGPDRYLASGEGIRPEQIHVVGRPQLAEIATVDGPVDLDEEPVLTVLYAPTWEGFFDDADYSSLETMGLGILRMLLESPTPVRILFKPHPATGTRRPTARTALRNAERLIRSAPGGHRVVEPGPDSLYDAFNRADVLMSDVSVVITDFLASHKPYVVTNPRGWDADLFHTTYPATQGGRLLGPDCAGLDRFLADITGHDRLREQRERLAAYLLGDDGHDPVERFLSAVDGIVERNLSVAVVGQDPNGSSPGTVLVEPAQDDSAGAPADGAGAEEGLPDAVGEDVETHQATTRQLARRLVPVGLALSVIGMAVAALWPSGFGFLGFAALGYVLDPVLRRRLTRSSRLLGRIGLGVTFRVLVRHLLTCVLLIRSGVGQEAVPVLVSGLLALHAVRALTTAMLFRGGRRRAWPVEWRNLDVPGFEPPRALPAFFRTNQTRKVLGLDSVALLAVVGVTQGGPPTLVVAAVAVMLLGALGFAAAAGRQLLALRGRPDPDAVVQAVTERLLAARPAVAVYFSGPAADTHLLNAWMPVIDQLHGCVVIVRERVHLEAVATRQVPVLLLRRGADVERFRLPSFRLALYPSTRGRNNHMLRLPGIKDVLIGTGIDTHRPVSRVYDEIWVEDQAARDRLVHEGLGVRGEQVRDVGQPRLAGLQRATPGRWRSNPPFTVLYAPTHESLHEGEDGSSLEAMGPQVVRGLLEMSPLVRVLFRPDPATGRWRPRAAEAVAAVAAMVEDAGGPHDVVPRERAVHQAVNEADLVITDVSGLVMDCLYARKPYIVTNPHGLSDDEIRSDHPVTAWGHLLPADCSRLAEAAKDAREVDVLHDRRERLAAELFGELSDDPAQRFRSAVDELAQDPTASR